MSKGVEIKRLITLMRRAKYIEGMFDSDDESTGGLTLIEGTTGTSQDTIELDDTDNADVSTIEYSNTSSDSSVHSQHVVGPVDSFAGSSDQHENYSNDCVTFFIDTMPLASFHLLVFFSSFNSSNCKLELKSPNYALNELRSCYLKDIQCIVEISVYQYILSHNLTYAMTLSGNLQLIIQRPKTFKRALKMANHAVT
ncbi:hypothetical protein KIN20_025046 [Parelaphostrongylus tenuis]|uniref:Uncharacterized protein n=1 Tax=Parelaphostrongylus tenuis TaxID=148309 RepID=A0AAD5NAG1_PARTN|nr:hypothetical protein KIN20_025046 [Parelaphostrongylus tenuis]